jgi:hypothetical protein
MTLNLRRAGASALLALAAWPIAANAASTLYSRGHDTPARLLAMHNRERARINVPPLQWDPQLAAAAASYGPTLARLGRLQHSPRATRPGQRENLWMGTRGHLSPEQMVASWIEERNAFRPGIYPAVSRTGNWMDVSHYTQLIWKDTTRVGCAIQPAGQWDYLICRYSPPGNIDGHRLP